MKTLSKLMTFVTLAALVAFVNPTGHSYVHYAMNYNWSINTESGFMALLGCLLLGIIIFFFWSAWRTTEFVGKFIFFIILIAASFIAFTLNIFADINSAAWFLILVLYAFFIWGMIYPRMKYSLFKTRNVDDADTE